MGNGVGVDAHTGLDGALINAAVNVGHVAGRSCSTPTRSVIGADAPDTNGLAECVDRCRRRRCHASVNLPDIGLPLSLSALDFSGNDMACSDHV